MADIILFATDKMVDEALNVFDSASGAMARHEAMREVLSQTINATRDVNAGDLQRTKDLTTALQHIAFGYQYAKQSDRNSIYKKRWRVDEVQEIARAVLIKHDISWSHLNQKV